jgi:hypothetical protein
VSLAGTLRNAAGVSLTQPSGEFAVIIVCPRPLRSFGETASYSDERETVQIVQNYGPSDSLYDLDSVAHSNTCHAGRIDVSVSFA